MWRGRFMRGLKPVPLSSFSQNAKTSTLQACPPQHFLRRLYVSAYDRHFDAFEKKSTAVFGTRKKPAITPFQPMVAPTMRWNFS